MKTADKKVVRAWAMYDWANSVYNLVITTTFFPAYYALITDPKNPGMEKGVYFMGKYFINTVIKDYVLAFAFLVIAIISPLLSSIADYKGNKKMFLQLFCYIGAISCSLLFFMDSSDVTFGLICYMLACFGFYGSQVFYNSYLPDIASVKDMDRISAKGYTFGYIGSLILQIIGFVLVSFMEDKTMGLRLTFLLVGLWWVGFAQITFRRMPKMESQKSTQKSLLLNGFYELKKVYHQLIKLPVLKHFLLSFFFYSMGVQTVILVAIDFGNKVLQLSSQKLIATIMVIQLIAIVGAIAMSKLSNLIGNIRVLICTVVLWMVVCIGGYFIYSEVHFYIVSALVGLVIGGIQSMSRSTYSKLMPKTKDTASFFSFFDVTEKLAMVIGIFSFGFIESVSGNMRNAILVLIVFFILGLVFLISTLMRQKSELKLSKS